MAILGLMDKWEYYRRRAQEKRDAGLDGKADDDEATVAAMAARRLLEAYDANRT
jgi:hypothetical protein